MELLLTATQGDRLSLRAPLPAGRALRVGGSEGALHVADEVGISRGVEHVDLDAVPFDRGERQGETDPSPDLLRIVR